MSHEHSHDEHTTGHEHGHDHAHGDHGDDHGHGGIGKYFAVFIALIVLTALSFAAGSSEAIMSTPAVGWTIMIAISCCKALLVMLFFMHLIWEANWKYVLTIPASIMSVFLLLMLIPDIMSRTRHYSEERWLRSAKPQVEAHDESGKGSEGKTGTEHTVTKQH